MDANNIRVSVLGDDSSYAAALQRIEKATTATTSAIQGSFASASGFIKKSIGFIGITAALDTALQSASQMNSLQVTQATILTNQGVAKQYNLSLSQKQYKYDMAHNIALEGFQSKSLDAMATQYSMQTAINKSQIVQAQTQLMTNSDILKFLDTGKKIQNGPMKGISQNFQSTLSAAGNLATAMGGGAGGSISSSARMLARLLADPAKSMSAMKRFGVSLSQSEQLRIKSVEKTNGLMAAQSLMVQDINKHLANTAQNANSPMEKLKNDLQLIYTSFGKDLLPLLNSLAQTIQNSGIVQTISTILSNGGQLMLSVLDDVGKAIGQLMADTQPFFTLFTNTLLPIFFQLLTPLLSLASGVLTPLSKAMDKLVGNGKKVGTLAYIFQTMANVITKNLMVGVDSIVNAFSEMAKNGQLADLMNSIAQVFITLSPILPTLATSFTAIMVALTPVIVKSGPAIVKMFQIFADLLTGIIVPVLQVVSGLFKDLSGFIGDVAPVIAALAAAWFTRRLFIAPIQAIGNTIDGTIQKVGKLKSSMSSLSPSKVLTKFFAPKRYARLYGAGEEGGGMMGAGAAAALNIGGDPIFAAMAKSLNNIDINVDLMYRLMKYSSGGAVGGAGGMEFGPSATYTPAEEEMISNGKGGRFAGVAGKAKGFFERHPMAGKLGGIAGLGALSLASGAGQAGGGIVGVISSVASGFGPWGMAISGAITGLTLLYQHCKWFRDVVKVVWKVIQEAIHHVIKLVQGWWKEFGKKITEVMKAVWKAIQIYWKIISTIIKIYIKLMVLEIKTIIAVVKFVFTVIYDIVSTVITAIVDIVKGAWKIITTVVNTLVTVFKFVWNLISTIVKTSISVVRDIISGFVSFINQDVQTITAVFDAVWNSVVNGAKWVWKTLNGWWNDLLGLFHTIAHMVTAAGKWIWAGLYNGFVDVANGIIRGFNDTVGNIPFIGGALKITPLQPMAAPKFHSGGIVPGIPGKEVPAVLQAGEAVISLQQMRNLRSGGSGGHSTTISPGAVVINIHGNADDKTAMQIKQAVNDAFKQFLAKATVQR